MDEWYTPDAILDPVRAFYGGQIDLDPASSYIAQHGEGKNKGVRAVNYFTQDDNGLARMWTGNVFLNPPFSQPLIEKFVDKAIFQYESLNAHQILILTNNSTETAWFQKLAAYYNVCLLKVRTRFWTMATDRGQDGPRQGQVLWYLGPSKQRFDKFFSEYGIIVCNTAQFTPSKEI